MGALLTSTSFCLADKPIKSHLLYHAGSVNYTEPLSTWYLIYIWLSHEFLPKSWSLYFSFWMVRLRSGSHACHSSFQSWSRRTITTVSASVSVICVVAFYFFAKRLDHAHEYCRLAIRVFRDSPACECTWHAYPRVTMLTWGPPWSLYLPALLCIARTCRASRHVFLAFSTSNSVDEFCFGLVGADGFR